MIALPPKFFLFVFLFLICRFLLHLFLFLCSLSVGETGPSFRSYSSLSGFRSCLLRGLICHIPLSSVFLKAGHWSMLLGPHPPSGHLSTFLVLPEP